MLAVAVLVVGLVVVFGDDDDEKPPPRASSSPSSSPRSSSSPSPTAGANGVHGDKIIDSATKWEFTKATSPWEDGVNPPASEIDNPVGQSVSLGDGFFASIQLGQLADRFGYDSPSDLKAVKKSVAQSMLGRYYGSDGADPESDKEHIDKAINQFGRKGWLWEYEISYHSGGQDMEEYVLMAVLDAGGGMAALFWGSVPDGHKDLKRKMIAAASTLKQRQ